MTTVKQSKFNIFALLLFVSLIASFFLLFKTGGRTLWDPDEGRYAEMIREMRELSNWVTPHLNYVPHLDKPPFLLWAGSVFTSLFGSNEFTLRLASGLAGIAGVLVCFFFAKRVYGVSAAVLSSLILATSFGYVGLARLLSTDMLICFFISLAIYLLYAHLEQKGENKQRRWHWLAAYITMGLGFLTKGLIAIVFPFAILFIYLALTKQFYLFRQLKLVSGLIISTIIALFWIIPISIQNKNFLYYFFIDQHILRFFTEKHNRAKGFFFPFLMTVGGFGPWSLFLPISLFTIFKSPATPAVNEERKKSMLFVVWASFVLLFFTFSKSKLPTYIGPLFMPLAILVGNFWNKLLNPQSNLINFKNITKYFLAASFIFCLTIILGVFFLNFKVAGSLKYSFAFFICGCLLILIPTIFIFKKNPKMAFSAIIAGEIIFLIYGLLCTIPYMDRGRETKSATQKLVQLKQPDDEVIFYALGKKASTQYYYQKPNRKTFDSFIKLVKWSEESKSKRYFVLMNRNQYYRIIKNKNPLDKYTLFSQLNLIHEKGSLVILSNKQ